jgi:hypothetical protein
VWAVVSFMFTHLFGGNEENLEEPGRKAGSPTETRTVFLSNAIQARYHSANPFDTNI